MMGSDHVIERLYDAYNRQDAAAAGALYHPEATHEDIAHGQIKRGSQSIAAGLQKFFGWFPDAHWDQRARVDGSCGAVAATYLLTATLQSNMGPIIASGQGISLRGVLVLDISDGLIRRSEDYWDAATFQRQLNQLQREVMI